MSTCFFEGASLRGGILDAVMTLVLVAVRLILVRLLMKMGLKVWGKMK